MGTPWTLIGEGRHCSIVKTVAAAPQPLPAILWRLVFIFPSLMRVFVVLVAVTMAVTVAVTVTVAAMMLLSRHYRVFELSNIGNC